MWLPYQLLFIAAYHFLESFPVINYFNSWWEYILICPMLIVIYMVLTEHCTFLWFVYDLESNQLATTVSLQIVYAENLGLHARLLIFLWHRFSLNCPRLLSTYYRTSIACQLTLNIFHSSLLAVHTVALNEEDRIKMKQKKVKNHAYGAYIFFRIIWCVHTLPFRQPGRVQGPMPRTDNNMWPFLTEESNFLVTTK
jgi:hypothetical protein